MTKAEAVAEQIATKVAETLAGLDRAMVKWPAEFRAIMWGAVAAEAAARARNEQSKEPVK